MQKPTPRFHICVHVHLRPTIAHLHRETGELFAKILEGTLVENRTHAVLLQPFLHRQRLFDVRQRDPGRTFRHVRTHLALHHSWPVGFSRPAIRTHHIYSLGSGRHVTDANRTSRPDNGHGTPNWRAGGGLHTNEQTEETRRDGRRAPPMTHKRNIAWFQPWVLSTPAFRATSRSSCSSGCSRSSCSSCSCSG